MAREIRIEPGDEPITVRVPDEVPPLFQPDEPLTGQEHHRLVIKPNNASFNEQCILCGERPAESPVPYAIFPEHSYEGVCGACIAKHAPDLRWMLNTYYEFGGGI